MNKKILAALLAASLAAAISACGHAHTFAQAWSADEEGHWHAATCAHTAECADLAAHEYAEGKCLVCGYEHAGHLFGKYEGDAAGHFRTCSVCHKRESGGHLYRQGICVVCAYAHEDHVFASYTEEEGGHAAVCSVCGLTAQEEHRYREGVCIDCGHVHTDHTFGTGYSCTVCGMERPYARDGGKIFFGSYPQTEIDGSNDPDGSLRNSLNMAAGARPAGAQTGRWQSYRYLADGGLLSDMWYLDVSYGGGEYRGVYFTAYRPVYPEYPASFVNGYQDDNGYFVNTVYWFRYEPIEWRILEEDGASALLMANFILDCMQFDRAEETGGEGSAPNNYEESDLRNWLTGVFFGTAFREEAQKIVERTEVDNGAATTASGENPFACPNTQDKVFLLSYADVLDPRYGFGPNGASAARSLKATDYAKAQGADVSSDYAYRGCGRWWLRSPDETWSTCAECVGYGGEAGESGGPFVYFTGGGIVPALRIIL